MSEDTTHTTFGRTGLRVHRLGLAASYWPGKQTIHRAIDAGVNCFFAYGFDVQMMSVLRDVFRSRREDFVIATGAYNLLYGHTHLRRTLEKRLRQLQTDYIDLFLFIGVMKAKQYPESVAEELLRLRDEGKVRFTGLSTHDQPLADRLAEEGGADVLMIRYNAAHRDAEESIFPRLTAHNPGIIGYTATHWKRLLQRPKDWPKDAPLPTPGQCYRFALSNAHVHVCLNAPANLRQLEENLEALRKGPLDPEEDEFMRNFGDAVRAEGKWFM